MNSACEPNDGSLAPGADDFDAVAYINEPRWQASRYGLDRIRQLLERLGRPQDAFAAVHVAGTNGKGSTCAYVASVLQAAGYRTGLFTSPYLEVFEERIRVNGANISAPDLRAATLAVRDAAEALAAETGDHPTEFELMTAVAFLHFARCGCEIALVEVGLGGRLDSTNVLDAPEVCAIARIGLDHTALLGSTLGAIAAEKAGIIKPGVPVASYAQDAESAAVIAAAAAAAGSTLTVVDPSALSVGRIAHLQRPFSYGAFGSFTTQMLGSYQPSNAALALEIIGILRKRGWSISPEALQAGIAAATWPGRFELLCAQSPHIIVDGGHNPQGARALAQSLADALPGECPVFIVGLLADKDYPAMLREVAALGSAYVCVMPPNPRALPAAELACALRAARAAAGAAPCPVLSAPHYDAAVETAANMAGPEGCIVAFGSLYQISAVKEAVARYLRKVSM